MHRKKVAIIFYGLSRTLEKTIDSIKHHLFSPLEENSIEYDIFIHTYKIFGPYHNEWSSESTPLYKNEDIEKILNPKYYIYSDQGTVICSIDFEDYYKKLGNWTGMSSEMTKYLIKNLCLALYSKKQITLLFEQHKEEYDYAIICRPDMQFNKTIDIDYFKELNDSNIIIPDDQWWTGCNDRFCIGTPNVVLQYGKLFDELKTYSENKSIISERYLYDKLKEKGITIIPKKMEYVTLRI